MKVLRVLCVLALVALFAGAAYAETQSVKVSGDLTMRGIFRSAYDYRGSTPEPDIVRTGLTADTGVPGTPQSWFMTVAAVQIDADMTDNVSTCIRLFNERDWDVRTKAIAQGTGMQPNGDGGYVANMNDFNVNVDLAYVTLKEFIYSPLTVTIGRQDLWFGKGFIVGANLPQTQYNQAIVTGYGRLRAPEYSEATAFDSIKAVLDYDPWTITGVYAKIWENEISPADDVDLWGVNVGYKFDQYRAEAEAYWFYKDDQEVEKWAGNKGSNSVNTLGLRGSFDPIDVVTIAAEGAYQFGSVINSRSQLNEVDRSAWALDIAAEWRVFQDRYAWKPKLAAEYIMYSGSSDEQVVNNATGTWHGWDRMFRGKYDSAIREWVGTYYASYDYPARANYINSCADASYTNQHQVAFTGSIQPVESLTLQAKYLLFWTYADYLYNVGDNIHNGGFIGQEVDLTADWDYTEDVSFGLLGAFFVPGDVYVNADKTATDVVGTVKVSF
ncbi:MAG: alginate export family protein [Candidatus Omnitrophica bacterium]|nr:alginate export family protein [Candidatus Omnitrophota bacterium]